MISLACLLLLCVLNLKALPLLWDSRAYDNFIYAIAGLSVGIWVAYIFMHGKTNVFVHEFKHALISGLVGNRATGLKIERDTGLFTYSYNKEDAHYNALINLAPYCVHLFTVPALIIAWLFFSHNHAHMVFAVGVGFGCDLLMNFREVSPVQTDLTTIIGGYGVAVLFVVAFNLCVTTFILAWFFQDVFGLKVLMAHLWDFGVYTFYYISNR